MTTLAVLPEGTVSDEAARLLCAGTRLDVTFRYEDLIQEVFLSTASGASDYSVIPIENTIEGSVSLHMDWLIHEVDLPIRAEWVFPSIQNLIGRRSECSGPDGALEYDRIVKVISHPVAMAQCTQFLRSNLPHAARETVSSTSQSIKLVRDNPGSGWAAIGTERAAGLYGLDVLTRNVTDHDNNYTRFLLIGREPFTARESDKHKTSIVIMLPEDYPGALHQVLSAFAWRKINLSKIESRPTKMKLGSYYFHIDIEMALDSVLLPAALEEIEAIGCQVRVLGSYPTFAYEDLV